MQTFDFSWSRSFAAAMPGSAFDDDIFYAERVCSTFLTVKPFALVSFFSLLISLSTNHAAGCKLRYGVFLSL